jgi:peptidoglycan hydrolase-like protein with peptidoglycan-binding domain
MQKRLTALGYDTEHTNGRTGIMMLNAVREFQRKSGMKPVTGYPGLQVLTRLRQG